MKKRIKGFKAINDDGYKVVTKEFRKVVFKYHPGIIIECTLDELKNLYNNALAMKSYWRSKGYEWTGNYIHLNKHISFNVSWPIKQSNKAGVKRR